MLDATSLSSKLISKSDKFYWHRYVDTYLAAFEQLGDVKTILEYGVYHGDSVKWLLSIYPQAQFIGADILPVQPDWPISTNISYAQLDQSNRLEIRALINSLENELDLVIEDGSHIPQHQASCLIETFHKVRSGGLYVLEDLCTSHPLNESFGHHSVSNGHQVPNALHLLMAVQNIKDLGKPLSSKVAERLCHEEFFTTSDVVYLYDNIDRVQIYKRSQLPLYCYNCGNDDFDYVTWKCSCGIDLYEPTNSMSALIWKK